MHKCWELVSVAAHSLGTLSPGFLINFVSLHLSTEQLMCDLKEHSEELQGVGFWVVYCQSHSLPLNDTGHRQKVKRLSNVPGARGNLLGHSSVFLTQVRERSKSRLATTKRVKLKH